MWGVSKGGGEEQTPKSLSMEYSPSVIESPCKSQSKDQVYLNALRKQTAIKQPLEELEAS